MQNLAKALRKFLSLSVFLITVISSIAYCHESEESKQECQQGEKCYVSPRQVEITDETIIIWSLDGKDCILTDSLAFDAKGLYIKQPPLERGPCGLHTRWCKICGGCGVLLCPMNCTCFD